MADRNVPAAAVPATAPATAAVRAIRPLASSLPAKASAAGRTCQIPPERADIEARIEGGQHEQVMEEIGDTIDKVLQALRDRD